MIPFPNPQSTADTTAPKLPVRDLARSEAWYGRTLGYRRAAEFVEQGC
ncbi:hypothetical protein SAZ11_59850 [Streptomyces sp. FXJ1.4098]|nr:hypothetical protein [Streptomyces sp. FXJ1.4098]